MSATTSDQASKHPILNVNIEDIFETMERNRKMTEEMFRKMEESNQQHDLLMKRLLAGFPSVKQEIAPLGDTRGTDIEPIRLRLHPRHYTRHFEGFHMDGQILHVSPHMMLEGSSATKFSVVLPLATIKVTKNGVSNKSNPKMEKLAVGSPEVILQSGENWVYAGSFLSTSRHELTREEFAALPPLVQNAVYENTLSVGKRGKKKHGIPDVKTMYAEGLLTGLKLDLVQVGSSQRIRKVISFVDEMLAA